jgi:hypothetical protein
MALVSPAAFRRPKSVNAAVPLLKYGRARGRIRRRQMAEILGLGMTHCPPLLRASDMIRPKQMMLDPQQPEELRDPSRWPAEMRKQWGSDEGMAYDAFHRAEMVEGFRWARAALDDFAPDFVIIFGDDQYENFQEDCVPAFQVGAYDGFDIQPFLSDGHHAKEGADNPWGEDETTAFHFNGHREAGKFLASQLISRGFDVAYAYRSRLPMTHAFLNTVLFLDWDRIGFDYPVLPFAVNCYGRTLVPLRGMGVNRLSDIPSEDQLDPPSPPPWRCYDLGTEVARILRLTPWRVAIIASGSWSHAWTSPSTSYFHPNVPADRLYLEALRTGDYETWRKATTEDLEVNGKYELICWHILLGAMAEMSQELHEVRFMPSWITNADKVFALFQS